MGCARRFTGVADDGEILKFREFFLRAGPPHCITHWHSRAGCPLGTASSLPTVPSGSGIHCQCHCATQSLPTQAQFPNLPGVAGPSGFGPGAIF